MNSMIQMEDPSLAGGFVEIYQTEKQFQIFAKELSYLDIAMVRLFRNAEGYKIELTSESNINFFYQIILTVQTFNSFVKENELSVSFSEFPEWLKKTLNDDELAFEFELKSRKESKLKIKKKQKYKTYEIMKMNFEHCSPEHLKESVMYRYERMRVRLDLLKEYHGNISSIIKTKNPSLFMQLNRKEKKSNKIFK